MAYQVKYSWEACVIDGVTARRVQSLGSTTDFAEEKLLELGNSGYAEVIDTPSIDITLDTNDWGSTNTMALLAGLYKTAYSAYNGGYKTSEGDNSYYITEESFEESAVDMTAPVSEDGSNLHRTLYLGYCFVNGISLSYDVGGVASENYSIESDFKRWYLNDHKKAVVYTAYHKTATEATISGTDISVSHEGLLVSVNGVVQADELASSGRPGLNSTIVLATDGSDTAVTCTANPSALTLVAGDRIRVLAHETGASDMTTLASTPDGIGGLRKGMVDIHLSNAANTTAPLGTDKSLRVQSVSIDVDLSREELEELGNYRAYLRSVQSPIPISATITINDSDLQMWADLSQLTWNSSLDELDIEDFVKTSILEVKIYSDKKDHTIDTTGTHGVSAGSNTLLKVVRLEGCSVASEGHSISVGGIAQQEYSLTAENFIVSGTGLNPLL